MRRRRARVENAHERCADRGCALDSSTVESRLAELATRADLERRLQGAQDESAFRLELLEAARREAARLAAELERAGGGGDWCAECHCTGVHYVACPLSPARIAAERAELVELRAELEQRRATAALERDAAQRAERQEARWRYHYEAERIVRTLAERTLLERRHQSVRRVITGPIVDRIGLAEDLLRSSAGDFTLMRLPVHALGGGLLTVPELADLVRTLRQYAPEPRPRIDGAP